MMNNELVLSKNYLFQTVDVKLTEFCPDENYKSFIGSRKGNPRKSNLRLDAL